ncbi:hypothetical protein [Oerskovia turbata]
MENDSPSGDTQSTARRPSAAEAREALAGLHADDASLAQQLVTPRWYHPLLGVIVALIITSQALPSPASLALLPVALFALPALVLVYRRRYGLWFSLPAGPRSKRVYRVMLVIMLLCFGAMVVIKVTPVAYGWVLVPAAVGLVTPMVLGPRYDDLFRRELAGASAGTDGRPA